MLTSIHCKRFRGFRALDASVGPVTALFGPNSSGKTTALHLIKFACEVFTLALRSEDRTLGTVVAKKPTPNPNQSWIHVSQGTLLKEPARLVPLADWQALFLDQHVGEGDDSTLGLRFEEKEVIQGIDVRLYVTSEGQVKVDVKALVSQESLGDGVDLAKGKLSKDQLSRLKNTLKDHAPLAALIPPFYGTVPNEELRARVVVDRLLGSGDQSRVVRNLVSDLDETQFRRLSGFLDEVLGVRLTYRTQGDDLLRESPLVLRFRDTNGDIEIASAGAGLVNLVALFAALSRWQAESKRRNVLFLIDEPEAHLHPKLQVQSVARLASLVTEQFGAQLFLATHSVDILNHLSGAGACLLRCDRTANPSAVSLTHEAALFDDIAQWADLTPYTAINALASRRILFCEGDVDAKLLPLLGALRFRDDPRRAELLRRWTFVRLHGTGNAKLASLLDDLFSDELMRAGLKDSPLRLLVVLDRDHARTPGRVAANPERPHAQTLVWSRHSLESLFLDERTLAPWLRALFKALGADPHAAPTAAIAQALLDADADQDLCDRATEQLTAKIISAEQRDPQGKRGDALAVYAVREATERVRAEPAVWQRGKDRARRVLGALREASPVGVRNQFPTDLSRFVERACAELGDPVGAVPSELNELFAYMAAP